MPKKGYSADIIERSPEAELERELAYKDLRFSLNTQEGRRTIQRLINGGGVYKKTFTGNSEGFFNEGARMMAVKLAIQVAMVDPKIAGEMLVGALLFGREEEKLQQKSKQN